MLRHQIFFEKLGSIDPAASSWDTTLAGLAVLRLLDSLEGSASADAASIQSIRHAIAAISETDPTRRLLGNILDALESGASSPLPAAAATATVAYAKALDFSGRWDLARDVFLTVAEHVSPEREPDIAIDANVGLGGASRRAGDWETSERGYARAIHIADRIGNQAAALTAQVGLANNHLARGNLPAAESLLSEVASQSRQAGFDAVTSMALHSRATIFHLRGNFADAILRAREALALTTDPRARDAITADIGAAFGGLGMHEAARDVNLILSATSQYEFIRSQALINLLDSSIQLGNEQDFDRYLTELEGAEMDPRLFAYYLHISGTGYARFGRSDLARATLKQAVDHANASKLHQIGFEADEALAGLEGIESAATALHKVESREILDEVHRVAEEFLELRDSLAL